jgi:transposase
MGKEKQTDFVMRKTYNSAVAYLSMNCRSVSKNVIKTEFSNGVIEGVINKIKVIKRKCTAGVLLNY